MGEQPQLDPGGRGHVGHVAPGELDLQRDEGVGIAGEYQRLPVGHELLVAGSQVGQRQREVEDQQRGQPHHRQRAHVSGAVQAQPSRAEPHGHREDPQQRGEAQGPQQVGAQRALPGQVPQLVGHHRPHLRHAGLLQQRVEQHQLPGWAEPAEVCVERLSGPAGLHHLDLIQGDAAGQGQAPQLVRQARGAFGRGVFGQRHHAVVHAGLVRREGAVAHQRQAAGHRQQGPPAPREAAHQAVDAEHQHGEQQAAKQQALDEVHGPAPGRVVGLPGLARDELVPQRGGQVHGHAQGEVDVGEEHGPGPAAVAPGPGEGPAERRHRGPARKRRAAQAPGGGVGPAPQPPPKRSQQQGVDQKIQRQRHQVHQPVAPPVLAPPRALRGIEVVGQRKVRHAPGAGRRRARGHGLGGQRGW